MRLEMTTGLVPFININSYNSEISSEYQLTEFDDEEVIAEFEERDEDINHAFNLKEYEKFIYECSCIIFNEHYLPHIKALNIGIFNGKCVSYYSPKSGYGEQIYFDLLAKSNLERTWEKYKKKLESDGETDDFEEFLHDNYSSYSGFSSFMPNTISKMDDFIKDDDEKERVMAAILTYELKSDDNEYQELLLEEMGNKKYNYDFFNSYDKQLVEKMIIKFNNFIKK